MLGLISDPAKVGQLAQLKMFSLASTNSFNPLQEKELLHIVKNHLTSKGYVYSEKHPDFVVSIDFAIDPVQVSGTTFMSTSTPGTTSTTSGYLGSGTPSYFSATTTTPGQTQMVPIPYSDIAYHRAITINFTSPEGIPLWRGEAESTGSKSDLLVVAPYLIKELLTEFPRKTGKKTGRYVPVK